MADTLTFQKEIAKVVKVIGSYKALREATNDHTRVGGLVFGKVSDLRMTGF